MVQFDTSRLAEICRAHEIRRLRLFGSFARGQEGPDSDVDLIVDFRGRKSLFDLMDAEESLAELFARDVDLLTEPGLSPYMRDSILAETQVIFDAGE